MRCPIESGEGELLLDSAPPASLGKHIRECRACREFAEARRAVDSALDLWEAPAVSMDFDRRLYLRIDREVMWWDFLVRPFRAPMASPLVPMVAAAAVMLAAGLWMERPGTLPAPAAPSARIEALPPEQAEHALQDMETMQELGRLLRADAAEPKM